MNDEVAIKGLGQAPPETSRAGDYLGYDLQSGQPVVPTRVSRDAWRALGPAGVCLGCYFGYEGVPAGTRTPLIHKAGPQRGAHFAHPAGRAPTGTGLSGETIWHIRSKHMLVTWARTQPGVRSAECEWTADDRSRRADVLVTRDDGRRLAFEVQQRLIPKDHWAVRRASYRQLGIDDCWFWSPSVLRPHGIDQAREAVVIDPDGGRLGLIIGPGGATGTTLVQATRLAPVRRPRSTTTGSPVGRSMDAHRDLVHRRRRSAPGGCAAFIAAPALGSPAL